MSDLAQLLALQEHDTAADQLRHRRTTLPERKALADLEAEIARVGGLNGVATARRDQLVAAQDALETEITACRTKRASLEKKLAATSVPKDAQAMSTEIDSLRERQRGLEDREIEIMEELEPVDAEIAGHERVLSDLGEQAAGARDALTAAEAVIDAELATVLAERQALTPSVSPPMLARYDRLRVKFGGVAVARLDKGRCTGCSLALSTLELDRVRHEPPDAIVECEQCGRLLVR